MEDKKLKVTLDNVPENAVENAVAISNFSITYTQNPDTNSSRDEHQYLTITALNNGAGGDGWYYDIKTDTHWSIDDANSLAELIKDFMSRMELNITKESDIKTY